MKVLERIPCRLVGGVARMGRVGERQPAAEPCKGGGGTSCGCNQAAGRARFAQVMDWGRVGSGWVLLSEASAKMALTRVVPPKHASGVGRRWWRRGPGAGR